MATTNFNADNLENQTPEQIFIAFSNLTAQNVEPCCEDILHHYNVLNKKLGISHLFGGSYYQKLKEAICNNLRAKSIWQILDRKADTSVYGQQALCKKHRIAIVGAGPIGLRMAIEGLLLGAEVHVIEKRTSFTRNNVAHLWHFTIEDFKMLGVKKLFGGFCAGNINHISIRRVQCIFLQVSLMLGVHFHAPLEYVDIVEPDRTHKWRLKLDMPDHEIASLDFDFIVAADGARTKFRTVINHVIKPGKLCLGITANYRNNRTQKEMEVQSIAGVAAIYDQQFFRSLKSQKDIELENIVYYKDDTHYFVMTAKKKNLLAKKVLKSGDAKELGDLCRPENIDHEMLYEYVEQVNAFATGLELDFYIKKNNRPDVSIFDFSRRAVSTNACRMFQKHGSILTVFLVGDSLIEPFWPLGTGLALGVLTVLDTAWFMKGFAEGVKTPNELVAERESLFKILNSEFSSNNLLKPYTKYSIDPKTRYHNHQIPTKISTEQLEKYSHLFTRDTGKDWRGVHTTSIIALNSEMNSSIPPSPHPYKSKPAMSMQDELKSKIQSKNEMKRKASKDDVDKVTQMETWFRENLANSVITIDKSNFYATFQDGTAFAYIISRYRPALLDMKEVNNLNPLDCLEKVFKIADEEFGISPISSASMFLFHPDKLETIHYLIQWHDFFKKESIDPKKRTSTLTRLKNTFKRKHGGTRKENKVRGDAKAVFSKSHEEQNTCRKCSLYIYTTEKITVEGAFFHRKCFACEFTQCTTQLTSNNCSVYHNEDGTITFLCPYHFSTIESADSAAGCNTLKHAKNFADVTTEQLATQAFEVRNRALTSDNLNDSPKEVVPIISNEKSNRDRAISQPLLDSPTLPPKFNTSPHKSRYENKAKDAPNALTSPVRKAIQKPITIVTTPTRTNERSPPVLKKVQKQSPQSPSPKLPPKSHPYLKVREESPLEKEVNKLHIPESVSETILSAVSPKHKKSSYEPRYEFGNNRRFSSFVLADSDLFELTRASTQSSTRSSRLSNYPIPIHKTSMNDLLEPKDKVLATDIGPNPRPYHRYNKMFKAQSTDALLGTVHSANEHFSRTPVRKHSKPPMITVDDHSDKQRRLSEVQEAIAKHPMKSRNSVEMLALKSEEQTLSNEIALAVGEENGKSSRSSTLTRGQVGEIKITPNTCVQVAIASIEDDDTESPLPVNNSSSSHLEMDQGLIVRQRSHRVVTTDSESNNPVVYRSRVGAHTGQDALYRSKRYRTTRTISKVVSERKSVDTSVTLSQTRTNSEDEDNDSDRMQEENQREQDEFRRALELDQKMDLVQQKFSRLEEKGKYYESKMRNTDNKAEEGRYLIEWSNLIDQKNDLVRQERDLSLEFKEHQLNDEYCRVENELRKKQETDPNLSGVESKALLNEKINILAEMDDLVQVIDQERINEREDDEHRLSILPTALENFPDEIMADAVFIPDPNKRSSHKNFP